MTCLELSDVTKTYGATVALHRLHARFESAQTSVLLGQSGCGKSTLLKIILGIVLPDSGTVRIGDDILRTSNALTLRRMIGYVVQSGGLFPHLTAGENVTLVADYLKLPAAESARRLDELLELTALPPDSLQRFPSQLSGGQQQRVGLMRALMLDPPILLLDEPLGALDPVIRCDMQADLRRIIRSLGKTALIVTHDIAEAAFFADDILLLHEGRMLQRGSFEDLVRQPSDPFVTRFVRAQRPLNSEVTT